jgi:anaphase-promoting complex subunit 4
VHSVSIADMQQYIKHTFASGDWLKPSKFEVNGRKNRRFVIVLGEDCRQMRIFDLDFKEANTSSDRTNGRSEEGYGDEMMND